jgi:hypothetical protein
MCKWTCRTLCACIQQQQQKGSGGGREKGAEGDRLERCAAALIDLSVAAAAALLNEP